MREFLQVCWLYWDEVAVMVACGFICMSCFLYVNHLPSKTEWVAKGLTYFLGFGAFGLGVSPIGGHFLSPTVFHLAFIAGVSMFSVWLTRECWMELPVLWRLRQGPAELPALKPLRGVPTEELEHIHRFF